MKLQIEYEIQGIQEGFAEITNSATAELRKFATEQQKYNEEQINILLKLKGTIKIKRLKSNLQVKEKLVSKRKKFKHHLSL